ncbi:MAG: glycosyltransferase family 4 protein [Candidatus Methanomethyliaceae archaeon]
MKILVVHNFYKQPGGEDVVCAQEIEMLRQAGHEVITYHRSNREVDGFKRMAKLVLAGSVVWAARSHRELRETLRRERPHVVHFHNTFLMVSPSAYYACREAGVPVVQTLHNYRLLCPRADFFRADRICEECVRRLFPWPGVAHACYHGSRLQTTGVAAMLTVHRALGTWSRLVDAYVALTEFARRKFVEGGLPGDRILVKPNFVFPDPGGREAGGGKYAIFLGRFSPEKRIVTVLRAWRHLSGVPLKIVGDGPEAPRLREMARRARLARVEFLGWRPRPEAIRLLKGARVLVFPSEWYESFPMTIAEAFACGVPVIATRLGAMAEIVEDGRTGLHFTPGDPEDLAAKVEWAWTHPKQMVEMGREARREYEAKYTAKKNYEMLMEIYRMAIERARGRR